MNAVKRCTSPPAVSRANANAVHASDHSGSRARVSAAWARMDLVGGRAELHLDVIGLICRIPGIGLESGSDGEVLVTFLTFSTYYLVLELSSG